jgi:hypothetical protein
MKFTIRDLRWLTLVIAIPLGQCVWFREDGEDGIRRAEAQWDADTDNMRRTLAAPTHPKGQLR